MLDVAGTVQAVLVQRTVAKARSGDPDAIARLYDLFADRVYRFALVRVESRADAEDVLQQTFVKMIEALPRYEDRGLPFAAWLFRIARNTVIDVARSDRGHADLTTVAEHADDRRGPAEQAEAASDRAAVRAAIGRLTPDQRTVIEYRFFAGLSHGEIGRLMNRREGAVRALQFRAVEALHEELGALLGLDGASEVGS
ncbi:MAG TPA: sigma-70 family RNA polymerase sigma factor [Candidatus Limnocylindrales bacterium]|nr:sigma-70 family RNA polymerase sigma factor [Candidatus Limnocylindrales bacterium]